MPMIYFLCSGLRPLLARSLARAISSFSVNRPPASAAAPVEATDFGTRNRRRRRRLRSPRGERGRTGGGRPVHVHARGFKVRFRVKIQNDLKVFNGSCEEQSNYYFNDMKN